MKAGPALVAGAVIAGAAAGAARWYAAAPEPAVLVASPPPPAPAANTLAASGPQALTVRLVRYQGASPLTSAPDTTGRHYDLGGIFQPVNLQVNVVPEPVRPYPFGSQYLTEVDISTLAADPAAVPQPWTVTGYLLHMGTMPGELGVLLGTRRDQFAVFTSAHPAGNHRQARVLRTTAHEIGHALNVFHDDGDGTQPCCSGTGDGRSLMNQDQCLDQTLWTFQLAVREVQHFMQHPLPSLDPGGSVKFGDCTTGHTRRC